MKIKIFEPTNEYYRTELIKDIEEAIRNPPDGYFFQEIQYAYSRENNSDYHGAMILYGELPNVS